MDRRPAPTVAVVGSLGRSRQQRPSLAAPLDLSRSGCERPQQPMWRIGSQMPPSLMMIPGWCDVVAGADAPSGEDNSPADAGAADTASAATVPTM